MLLLNADIFFMKDYSSDFFLEVKNTATAERIPISAIAITGVLSPV